MSNRVGRPVPLFMDVDGSLLANLADNGETSGRLTTFRLDRDLPDDTSYPARIQLDPDVVMALNGLLQEALVQLVWASTWDHAANRLLVPAIGLIAGPYDVAEIGTRQGDLIVAAGVWVKTLAVGRWLLENKLEGSSFVIVDDLLSNQVSGFMSPQRRSIEAVGGDHNLYIATHPQQGLQLAQMAEIRAFAEQMAAGTLE